MDDTNVDPKQEVQAYEKVKMHVRQGGRALRLATTNINCESKAERRSIKKLAIPARRGPSGPAYPGQA